jgi:hypothetical protein
MTFDVIKNTVADTAFAVKRLALGPERVRRVQVYGIGIGKSGTHSIAKMFSHRVRARHEPQAPLLIDKIMQWQRGQLSEQDMAAWLRERDRKLALEVDSSGLNAHIVNLLVREFPEARFVLSIRDCYSWTNSRMNGDLTMGRSGYWFEWVKFVYGQAPFVHTPGEQAFKERGLYPLESHFWSWATRNARMLATVPPDRLFVVRTDRIREHAHDLADFIGLPRRFVRLHRTHEFRSTRKQSLLREFDRDFIERKVEQHCRPLMQRFFPEIKSLDDVKL